MVWSKGLVMRDLVMGSNTVVVGMVFAAALMSSMYLEYIFSSIPSSWHRVVYLKSNHIHTRRAAAAVSRSPIGPACPLHIEFPFVYVAMVPEHHLDCLTKGE